MKVKSPLTGMDVEAVEVDFDATIEPWVTYALADGTTLKVRPMLIRVLRLEDYSPESGEPIYVVIVQNASRAMNVPEKLKKKVLGPSLKLPSRSPEVG